MIKDDDDIYLARPEDLRKALEKATINHGNKKNFEMTIEEDEDIYLTRPEDLRKAMEKANSDVNCKATGVSSGQDDLG